MSLRRIGKTESCLKYKTLLPSKLLEPKFSHRLLCLKSFQYASGDCVQGTLAWIRDGRSASDFACTKCEMLLSGRTNAPRTEDQPSPSLLREFSRFKAMHLGNICSAGVHGRMH